MEPMQITVLSLRKRDGTVVARARADAANALMRLEARFVRPLLPKAELWDYARWEVLTHLDPA
jgi:hypothetical protein